MRGYIRQTGKKSWQIQVYISSAEGRKRHFETVHSKRDAQKRLTELLAGLDRGIYPPSGKLTVADLLNQFLEGHVRTTCSIRTLDAIESIAKHHLIPALGHIPLKQLTPQAIQAYYGKACEKLSSRSVHYHHRILKQALKYGIRQGYLGRNPCELVDPPKPRPKPMRTLTPEELEALLEVASDNQFYPVIYTAVSTGLRQAELLGLRWRDIDLDLRSISVSQVLYKRRGVCEFKEPKTAHSRRRVRMTRKLADYLREYKAEKESLSLHLVRLPKLDDLVFSNVEGKPIDPGVLTHNFHRIAKRAGLENVRFHDLRHSFASFMLLRGVPAKLISEALGHSSVAFTMDVYSHIIEGMRSDTMELLDGIMPPGVNRANGITK